MERREEKANERESDIRVMEEGEERMGGVVLECSDLERIEEGKERIFKRVGGTGGLGESLNEFAENG